MQNAQHFLGAMARWRKLGPPISRAILAGFFISGIFVVIAVLAFPLRDSMFPKAFRFAVWPTILFSMPAIPISAYLRKRQTGANDKSGLVIMSFNLVFVIYMFVLGGEIVGNSVLDPGPIEAHLVTIRNVEMVGGKHTSYVVTVDTWHGNAGTEILDAASRWHVRISSLKVGDKVLLKTSRGAFGLERIISAERP